jgi:hypothetical protein
MPTDAEIGNSIVNTNLDVYNSESNSKLLMLIKNNMKIKIFKFLYLNFVYFQLIKYFPILIFSIL